jgi:hypothetical protein
VTRDPLISPKRRCFFCLFFLVTTTSGSRGGGQALHAHGRVVVLDSAGTVLLGLLCSYDKNFDTR